MDPQGNMGFAIASRSRSLASYNEGAMAAVRRCGPAEALGKCLLRHKADEQNARMNVRFEGNNRHEADVTRCLLMTQSGRH